MPNTSVNAEHDGRLAADVVAKWAGTHNKPFDLTLTDPRLVPVSTGGESVEIDAI